MTDKKRLIIPLTKMQVNLQNKFQNIRSFMEYISLQFDHRLDNIHACTT